MPAFAGKVVLVTGASRGLGRATAEAFLREGATVVGTGRNLEALARLTDALQAIGGTFQVVPLEVTDEAAVSRLIGSLDRLDILINNAGIARIKPFLETTTDELRHMLDVNVVGSFNVMREAVKKMVAGQGGGDVINIASDAAIHGIGNMTSYVASKHALLGMGRSVSLEVGGQNVRVVTVCPGPIDTGILGALPSGMKAIDPADLALTLVHIASVRRGMEFREVLIQPSQG